MENMTLKIEGMTCNGCARRVDMGLRNIPGVNVKAVSVGEAQIEFDPDRVTTTQIFEAISEMGFQTIIGK